MWPLNQKHQISNLKFIVRPNRFLLTPVHMVVSHEEVIEANFTCSNRRLCNNLRHHHIWRVMKCFRHATQEVGMTPPYIHGRARDRFYMNAQRVTTGVFSWAACTVRRCRADVTGNQAASHVRPWHRRRNNNIFLFGWSGRSFLLR